MRDYKFAINDLRGLAMFEHREEFIHTMDVESIDLAIEALEKQIPKKMRFKQWETDRSHYTWVCPRCGKSPLIEDFEKKLPFCAYCGQALDWTKEANDDV